MRKTKQNTSESNLFQDFELDSHFEVVFFYPFKFGFRDLMNERRALVDLRNSESL